MSNKSQFLYRKQKTKTLIVHIGVFGVLNKVLFQMFTGDVKKKTKKLFFCRL